MLKGYILGISCGYHDSAACLLKDGTIIGACEEERFTGIKHDASFPHKTLEWLFERFNITKEDIDVITFYETPDLKLDRIEKSTKRGGLVNYFNRRKIIDRNNKNYNNLISDLNLYKGKNTVIDFSLHHDSHLAYSYYTSPFESSAVISVDGVGEWETTSLGYYVDNKKISYESIKFPHSLGMFYSVFTAFLGFKPNEGEYKVMGLAPYGNSSKYINKFDDIVLKNGDGFELNMKYFTFDWSDTHMFNKNLGIYLGLENRLPEDTLTQDHKDLAAAVQEIYEKYFFKLLDKLYELTKNENLCLGGGCAYNGTANGKIKEKTKFKNIWIPPAPSDSGSAIGCALKYFYEKTDISTKRIDNTNAFLGPDYSKTDIESKLKEYSDYVYYEWAPIDFIIPKTAELIKEGNIIGWFQGRMEFGARALGNRSILANPRDPQMKSRLNMVIKKREGFRPFAPICIEEDLQEYFEYDSNIPYMNQVVKVKEEYRNELPAITHVDGSARVQTLGLFRTRFIYNLLKELKRINKYPIVVNTSFNLKDQTMVLTPEDAIKTFLNCEMDVLILGNFIVKKSIF